MQWVVAGSNVTMRDTDAPLQLGASATATGVRIERDAAGRAVAAHGCLRREQDAHYRLFSDFSLNDLATLGIRLNQSFDISLQGQRLSFQVVLSSGYPYTQHPEPNTVIANEDPEGWLIFFEVAMMRNASCVHLNRLPMKLAAGSIITVHAPPPPSPRRAKKLAMPTPIDLD